MFRVLIAGITKAINFDEKLGNISRFETSILFEPVILCFCVEQANSMIY
jgi:hypothetical protein